jgi:hypothetical protein
VTFRAPTHYAALIAVATILSVPVLASADVASIPPVVDAQADDLRIDGVQSGAWEASFSENSQPLWIGLSESNSSTPLLDQSLRTPALSEGTVDEKSIESNEQIEAEPVPEPSSIGLIALSGLLAAMAGARYRLG